MHTPSTRVPPPSPGRRKAGSNIPAAAVAGALLALSCAPAAAATLHCVSSASELVQALQSAAASPDDDEIRIRVGSYLAPASPPGGFRYVSSQAGSLLLSGGWSGGSFSGPPECVQQLPDPSLTVLEADYQAQVLVIQPGSTSGDVAVRNLTLTRGHATIRGGGLQVEPWDQAWSGSVLLQSLRILANESEVFAAGAYLQVPHGWLRFENSVVADNGSGSGSSGVDLTLGGASSLLVNLTVARNSSGDESGPGLRIYSAAGSLVQNSVFHDNGPTDLALASATIRLHHNHISVLQPGSPPAEEIGTLGGDPMLFGGSLGLTPTPASPLVDYGLPVQAGLPAHDVDGGGRIVGDAVDLGAFEGQVFKDGLESDDPWERPPPLTIPF